MIKPCVEPELISYGLEMETCTLRFNGVEYGYDLHYKAGESVKPAPEVEPVAWMIPHIIPYGPNMGNVAWGVSTFCEYRNQAMVDKNGKDHYPYPLCRFDQMTSVSDALKVEVERLRKDAERYRAIPWLAWYVGPRYDTYNDVPVEECRDYSVSKQTLDAAIDAAMKETK